MTLCIGKRAYFNKRAHKFIQFRHLAFSWNCNDCSTIYWEMGLEKREANKMTADSKTYFKYGANKQKGPFLRNISTFSSNSS